SLNMLTDSYAKESSGEISNSYGSFNTRKHTVKFSTGLIDDRLELAGRLSALKSDGYIDRASSDLKSYFLQGTYVGKTTLIKALIFGGKEKTYQSWNGLEDLDKLKNDRTFNTAGMFTDAFGNTRFYDNETDNYQQDHFQLHWNEKIATNWNTNLAVFYSKGKGFYENYKENAKFSGYGLTPIIIGGTTINKTDLIRQKWLDNDFYGTTFSANYKDEKLDVILGGGYNKYEGSHFGKIIWARYASTSELEDHYYNDAASKTDGNIFAKANYQVAEKLSLFADLQLRNVHYKANGAETGVVNANFNFFNPKAGLNLEINENNQLYASYARANREPNRTDYKNGSPRPEKLNDFELGLRHVSTKVKVNANMYYMAYKDQLILTGELDDVGAPIRKNSGDSYRLGLEIDATVAVLNNLIIRPNVTISTNKNKDFFFKRDGVLTSLGNTNIAFSPGFIAGNIVSFVPMKNLQISFLSKFVGEQYMANIDAEGSKLKSYFTNDLKVSYEIIPKSVFKSIYLSALVSNIFDYKYISNGYFYTYDDDYSNPPAITTIEGAGYYPQAGINFLVGLSLKF
ncbi:MAG TPA: TonB-dependent receptor, partial [Flavobacterium sp.]|nr:TonB-dependent receptor [Flavobacterium sp.]